MDIRDFFQPVYEMRGSPAFQGWLHSSGNMVTGSYDKSHGDMIRDNWQEMSIPYEVAVDAEDEYDGPAQMVAYARGWVRFYTSQHSSQGDKLYISGTRKLYHKMLKTILKFVREVRPVFVIFDIIDPEGYPTYVHGRQFMASDMPNIRDWLMNPETSIEDSRW